MVVGQIARFHKSDLSDRILELFFLRLLASGRERASFYTRSRMCAYEFIEMVRMPENPWWLLTFNEDMAGMVYLTDIAGKSAMIHFCFLPIKELRAESGVPSPIAVGRFAVSSILHDTFPDGTNIMDVVAGKTPTWNKAAVKMIRQCGAQAAGEIPSACFSYDSKINSPGLITYFTRESVPAEWAKL